MIWRKAWRESRARFLVGALLTVVFVGWAVLYSAELMRITKIDPHDYNKFVWRVYANRFQPLWVFAITFLGFGGLVRERALGTADFTLSLPMSRRSWMAVRVALGILESAVLAFLPAAVIPLASTIVGRSYSVSEAAKFSALTLAAGLLFFCLGFFYSSLLSGEYAAPAMGILSVFLIFTTTSNFDKLRPYSFAALLSGRHYVDERTWFLTHGWPWQGTLASLCVGVAVVYFANRIVERADF